MPYSLQIVPVARNVAPAGVPPGSLGSDAVIFFPRGAASTPAAGATQTQGPEI